VIDLTTYDLALAFTKACPVAGRRYKEGEDAGPEARARNLIKAGYILAGDPHEWAGNGTPIATIYCERHGGPGDCEPPADYYGRWPVIDLHDLYWEWNNAALGHVWADGFTVRDSAEPGKGLK